MDEKKKSKATWYRCGDANMRAFERSERFRDALRHVLGCKLPGSVKILPDGIAPFDGQSRPKRRWNHCHIGAVSDPKTDWRGSTHGGRYFRTGRPWQSPCSPWEGTTKKDESGGMREVPGSSHSSTIDVPMSFRWLVVWLRVGSDICTD